MSTNEPVCCAECRQAGHYAASDIPLILENSWLARTLLPSKDESGRSRHRLKLLLTFMNNVNKPVLGIRIRMFLGSRIRIH